MIVKSSLGPVHCTPLLSYNGVTVIVATTGALPEFNAVKLGTFPVPPAAKPIEVSVFVHVYVVVPPVFCVVNTTSSVVSPLQ